ncbi:MAG TPA: IPT/TIG domain-containing protein, partial [Thermoanaerobaculia bacterium]|nr:IPT/TIG domain-containing protein [Thermoanaerobaculia bacterium]
MYTRIAAVLLLTATVALADPVITSVTPNSGPVEGGTLVRLKGTGFSNNCPICSPPFVNPQVYFGSTQATDVRFIDSTTIDVVTPAVLPSSVSVTVKQADFSNPYMLPNAFTFNGDPGSAFDPVLFPLFTNAIVHGAFGSEFETSIRISDKG